MPTEMASNSLSGTVTGAFTWASRILICPRAGSGDFHARFSSGKFIETATQASRVMPIKVKDAIYPLTLSWKIKKGNAVDYWLTMPGTQGRTGLSGESGSMTLASSDNGVILLTTQTNTPAPCDPSATGRDQHEVLEKGKSFIPVVYFLKQNSPNPFNPTTTISYDLPEDARVTLKIFNVLGEEVMTLIDAVESAGYKSAVFDATNFSSGMYFYRIQAGKFSDTKKLLLIK